MEENNFQPKGAGRRILVVIPCLNEAAHIAGVVRTILTDTDGLDFRVVVADGGSVDGTQAKVVSLSATDPRIELMDNPRRIQSAAVNLAVARYGNDFDLLIRVDAHADYPTGYLRGLVEAHIATGAASVVVPMQTIGRRCFQKGVAAAQNSPLGNGGSAHRSQVTSRFVDHGHHALMDIAAFRAVGGYDETFSHNEDAELDHRLGADGHTIWLEVSQSIVYYPRDRAWPLFRQYYNYGKGRAKNLRKHNGKMKLRQALPLVVAPAVALAVFGLVVPVLVLPALLWALACLAVGCLIALKSRKPCEIFAGPAAMIMHLAWSAGFLAEWLVNRFGKKHAAHLHQG